MFPQPVEPRLLHFLLAVFLSPTGTCHRHSFYATLYVDFYDKMTKYLMQVIYTK